MRNIYVILLLNFITMTAFNMAHPVTPKLINELQLAPYMFGVLFSFMAVANYVMSPIWGSISDARGRKNFLALGVIGYGVAQIGFGLSSNEILILLFRLLGGAMAVCYLTTSIAYVTDLTNSENRIKYIAYYTATAALGSSAGSILGGIIGENNYKNTFVCQFIFCIIIAFILRAFIKETISKKKEKIKISFNHLRLKGKIVDFKSTLSCMMVVVTLLTISTTAYNSTISYYVESVLRLPTSINGVIMSVGGIVALCMNIFVNPYIDKKFNSQKSIIIIFFIAGISIIVASLFDNLAICGIFILLFIMSSSLLVPICQGIISNLGDNNYGQIMGMQGSAKALGMILGSLISGAIFEYGEKLPFLFGGISIFLAFLILFKIFSGRKLLNKAEVKIN